MHRVRLPLLSICWLLLLVACRPAEQPVEEGRGVAVSRALGGEAAAGYARAFEPRPFRFPEDHGPHPEFRTEWWYFTGNLAGTDDRRFGYQLTLFRVALAPEMPQRDSSWASRQIFMAHFALTDAGGGRFHHFERFSRAALGLAGAQAAPFRVWLEGWSVEGTDDFLPLRLQAAEGEVALDLRLENAKPVVLQGERGLSRKSDEAGNASYYYSLSRMPTVGEVRLGEEVFPVQGESWLDREWSTSALGEEQAGWDWFSLQLDDGRELMFYRLREKEGGASPWSAGTLVAADGSVRRLGHDEVVIEELDHWTSPYSGARYPSRWRLRIPAAGLDLQLEPLLNDQELRTTVRYWEGAVEAKGAVNGHGYVELTGY